MALIPMTLHRFTSFSVKMLSAEIEQIVLRKQNKVGDIRLPELKSYYKDTASK